MIHEFVYETEGMARVRHLLTKKSDITDDDVDTFKRCLAALEHEGFTLKGPVFD